MQESRDTELLRQYVCHNSEEAFAALVARHVNLVYSAALRKTGHPAAAEEITQAVFVILARKADELSRHAALSGWLYQAARLTAANFLRTEIRRARREQEAYMQSRQTEPELWPQIVPLLEDAMGRLGNKDRDALVLRFFEGKSFQEIGLAFGATENAAKKRVAYALEKLRKYFSQCGVTSTTATIAGAISTHSVQAAPALLAQTATTVAFVKGATASTSTLTLIQGVLKIMAWSKAKTAIVAGVVVLVAAGTATVTLKKMSPPENPASISSSQPSDASALQGAWGGQGAGAPSLKIQGSTLEFHGADPREWYRAAFTLREDITPKQLVAVVTDCPFPQYKGKTSYSIYQMQGDTLTFAGNEPGKPAAPESFDAPGARKFVFVKE